MQSLHGNSFNPLCCGALRKVLPGGIIICTVGCDSGPMGLFRSVPNYTEAEEIPKGMGIWQVPGA